MSLVTVLTPPLPPLRPSPPLSPSRSLSRAPSLAVVAAFQYLASVAMATASPPPPPDPLPLSAPDFPRLVAAYLPSPSSDDDDAVAADAVLDDDSPDSLDDWSDDRPDSADDYDHTSDSDDSSLAWNTKSKKHPHPHPHLHHKKNSFHSACDYLSFFGALRKGFCSRHLDQRIEVYKAHTRADKSTVIGGGDSVQQEKQRVIKTGTGGVSGGYPHKDHEGASSFSAMFKCTVADTPKFFLKRASFAENSDDQDINAHQAGAENVTDRDLAESDKKRREKAEREEVPELTMVLEPDGKGSYKKLTDGPQPTDNICKDMAHKEYGEAHMELGTNPLHNKSKLSDENLYSKEDDQSSKRNEASEKRSCWRESSQKGLHNKGDWKHAMPDSSNKSSKNQNQMALVNTLEPIEKGGVSLEHNAIQQSKDLQGKTVPSKDNSYEAAEMAEVPTSLDKKVTQTKALPDKAKLQDMPLHIYIKEKHPPEVVIKDPKRKTKAKKVKASKGKKLHLFRDGFTLPSATEPADDAESTPSVLDRRPESSNKVQSPTAAIPKEVVSTSAIKDMQPPIIGKMETGNAMEMVDLVPLRGATGPMAIAKTSATPVHKIKTQVGDPVSDDSGLVVVALPDSVPKSASYASASHQNVEDGASKISFTEGRHAAQPEAESSGSFEENSMKTVITSTPPPLQNSSRRWFPPSDIALLNPVVAPELATTLNGSLLAPQPLVGNSLATSTISYSPTALSHESESNTESFGNIQGNLVPTGISSASPNPSSFIEAPLASYHFGNRVAPPAIVSSCPRMLTMNTSDSQYSRLLQLPVSQSQAYAPNSVSTLSQQEMNPPALFHVDSRASGNSSWIQPGPNSWPGFSFPKVPTTTSFGQVIGCVNQTLSMYKQMKSFSIEARYLVNVPSIVPGCCKLFLFNIESRQLHGVYVSSSLQAMSVGHEFPVAFDCIENYSIPLSVEELDTVLPEARQMDGRPLFLQPHTVEQLMTLFERKNIPRLSWVPSTTNAVSVSGVHGLLEFSAISSESSSTKDRLVEAMGQGSSVISASPPSMAINEVAKDCWSPLSSSPSAKVPESGQAFAAHEPDSLLAPAQVFPFPASSINNGEGAKSVWAEVTRSGFSRKMPEQGVAPSPMALWPHLFPKASSADTVKENFMHMETREGNNNQIYHASVSEKIDVVARPDSELEALSFTQFPEPGIRTTALRPKLAYNPLAVEQGRQRHLLDGSKASSWSTLVPELDLQQTSQYGKRPRSQDDQYIASLSSPLISEQPKMNNISGGATIQSSATPAPQLPLHYQMDHALPDALRSDLGLSNTRTAQTTSTWSEEPHSMHLPTISSEVATGAANLDQTNLCCYCFTRRADHLIIDCQHLGPCLECAASKKIEYCGQLNCQTKVTRLLRLFR